MILHLLKNQMCSAAVTRRPYLLDICTITLVDFIRCGPTLAQSEQPRLFSVMWHALHGRIFSAIFTHTLDLADFAVSVSLPPTRAIVTYPCPWHIRYQDLMRDNRFQTSSHSLPALYRNSDTSWASTVQIEPERGCISRISWLASCGYFSCQVLADRERT